MQPRFIRAASIFALALILIAPSPGPPQGETRHHTGLALLGAATPAPQPLPEPLAKAWSDALRLAETNPFAIGYPWADPQAGEVVVPVTSSAGRAIIQRWSVAGARIAGTKPLTLPAPQVPVRTRSVALSWDALERIKHDAISLSQAGVPDAALIFQTAPDWERNRVIVTVERLSESLLRALAARYGTEAIAIGVERRPRMQPSRHADTSPFWGGAKINAPAGGASSGFAWTDGTTDYMLSAGHAAPNGGSVSTPAQFMGSVTSGSGENWTSGVGTVYLTGQSTNRGDLSLIQITNGSSGTSIYVDIASSENSATVKEMWYRSPAPGDQYCTGGSSTGEICGYGVEQVGIDFTYINGETIGNAVKGTKGGTCHAGGDSGGPVYTVRGDGGIAAKGIHSGGGFFIATCFEYFTDIWLAYFGFPGFLKTG